MVIEGKLVVIDGLDGSGKTTQFELIQERLKPKKVTAISFPDYDQPSSTLVKMYLLGEFSSDVDGVNAYAASSFYAVDRYASYKKFWEQSYKDGDLILASRYVSSNIIHQMVKLPHDEWNTYLTWLYDYEFVKLGLPMPNKVIFLDMPIEISQLLMTSRYDGDNTKKDIHEKDVDYLLRCREAALYAADKLNWDVIKCSDGVQPYSIDKINNEIRDIIFEVLI
ncbi:MAG: thymidylate kinase [Clostridiales bacterium]|nr:thymidylate kinase [Clostridiales bacterium]